MVSDDYQQRLSRIATRWTMLLEAHRSKSPAAQPARSELAQRYVGAVYRYLLAIVRDVDIAEELCQEFAVKFLEGSFRQATPERGRFRDYVKTVAVNLVRTHFRRHAKQPKPLPEQIAAAENPDADEVGGDFAKEWHTEILEQTWQSLLSKRPNYYHVLKLRVESPDLTSREMAERYATEQNLPMTPTNIRKILERAHAKFAELLVGEVVSSIDEPDVNSVRSELQELDLLRYCGTAFDHWSAIQ